MEVKKTTKAVLRVRKKLGSLGTVLLCAVTGVERTALRTQTTKGKPVLKIVSSNVNIDKMAPLM